MRLSLVEAETENPHNSVQPGRSELICLHWMTVVTGPTALLHTFEFFTVNTKLPEMAMLASKNFTAAWL